jgi:hypothetical protein
MTLQKTRIKEINTDSKEIAYYGKYILDIPYKGSYSIAEKNIINSSNNIINLIEARDIVNGYIVLDVGEDLKTGERQLEMSMDYPNDRTIYDSNDIKEVSIHEQYEQNSYKTNI